MNFDPIGDMMGGMLGSQDHGLRTRFSEVLIEDAVFKQCLMEYLATKGIVKFEEFDAYHKANNTRLRAVFDQLMQKNQEEALAKWKAENPDKLKNLDLMKKLLGIKDE